MADQADYQLSHCPARTQRTQALSQHLSPSFISHCVQVCADSRAAKDYYTVTQNFNLTVSARCIAAKHICIYMI